eukprot:6803-Rhodomonas_salina.1
MGMREGGREKRERVRAGGGREGGGSEERRLEGREGRGGKEEPEGEGLGVGPACLAATSTC